MTPLVLKYQKTAKPRTIFDVKYPKLFNLCCSGSKFIETDFKEWAYFACQVEFVEV